MFSEAIAKINEISKQVLGKPCEDFRRSVFLAAGMQFEHEGVKNPNGVALAERALLLAQQERDALTSKIS